MTSRQFIKLKNKCGRKSVLRAGINIELRQPLLSVEEYPPGPAIELNCLDDYFIVGQRKWHPV